MAKKLYKIEDVHTIVDVYYVEADSEEEAKEMFYDEYEDIDIDDTYDYNGGIDKLIVSEIDVIL